MGKTEPEYEVVGINTEENYEDKDQPQELYNEPAKQNSAQAVLSMAKAVVGAGSFALPYGVAEAGLIGGGVGLLVLGLICYYTIRILIEVKNSPKLDWGNNKYVTYADLAGKVLGPFFEVVVYIAIIITSLGACAAYLVFNGQLLNTLVPSVSIRLWVVILGTPLAILSLIKSLRYLSYTSILGDVALCLGFTTVFIIGFEHGFTPFDELELIRFATYPQFFGSAAFLFCVHMLMLPIEQSLEKPSQFNTALGVNFVIVTILNFFFSVFGYMFYGKYTNPLIINNLSPGILVTVTKIALVFDLFFTFLIVLVPAKDVIESSLTRTFLNPTKPTYPNILPNAEIRRAIIRLLLVLIIIGAGCSVTTFNDLTNLVSGLSLSLTAFILPPWMYIVVTLHEPPITNYKVFLVVCHTTIIVIGCFAAVVTTWTAITQIIADY